MKNKKMLLFFSSPQKAFLSALAHYQERGCQITVAATASKKVLLEALQKKTEFRTLLFSDAKISRDTIAKIAAADSDFDLISFQMKANSEPEFREFLNIFNSFPDVPIEVSVFNGNNEIIFFRRLDWVFRALFSAAIYNMDFLLLLGFFYWLYRK